VVETAHRSIHPNIPGVSWWAAVLIATTATAVGYAIDAGSGHKELTHTFAACYIAGCVAAVLAVRQSAVFTAVIQPPLILFCAVPGAYWLFHGGKIGNLKDLLINCGYPLIERFPLMLGTAGGVLLIGLIRWTFGMSDRSPEVATTEDDTANGTERASFFGGMAAKLASLLGGDIDDEDDEDPGTDSQPARPVGRARAARTSRARETKASRSAKRPTHSRSRHARPPLEDTPEPVAERARRPGRRSPTPSRDFEAADPPRRSRRRPRPQGDPDLRAQPPREMRREPHSRRSPYERTYERPEPGSSRVDPYDLYDSPDPSGAAEPFNRYERYGASYEPYEPYEQPRRRSTPAAPSGVNPTHHPISRVRYRGQVPGEAPSQAPSDEPRDRYRGEPRPDRRSRSGARRRPPAESWEYDA
jgi:hypothetical protein